MGKLSLIGLVLLGMLIVIPFAANARPAQANDAWIPGLASFLVPGAGQLMNGQTDKAVLHFSVDVVIWVGGEYITRLIFPDYYWWHEGYSIVGLAHLAWALYSGYDAYTVAKEKGFTLGFTDDGLTLSYDF